jgi:hypothetical protein
MGFNVSYGGTLPTLYAGQIKPCTLLCSRHPYSHLPTPHFITNSSH